MFLKELPLNLVTSKLLTWLLKLKSTENKNWSLKWKQEWHIFTHSSDNYETYCVLENKRLRHIHTNTQTHQKRVWSVYFNMLLKCTQTWLGQTLLLQSFVIHFWYFLWAWLTVLHDAHLHFSFAGVSELHLIHFTLHLFFSTPRLTLSKANFVNN